MSAWGVGQMKKFLLATAMSVALIAPAYSQFQNKELPNPTSSALECGIIAQTADRDTDPVYKIEIALAFEVSGKPISLDIKHTTVSGNVYSRSDQYTDGKIVQKPNKLEWVWYGSRKNQMMLGIVLRNDQDEWYYSEYLYNTNSRNANFDFNNPEKGSIYRMVSRCHVTGDIDEETHH